MNSKTVNGKATDKTILIHTIAISTVCIIMGAMNLIGGAYILGAITIVMSILISLISLVAMKKATVNTRGLFLTQITVIVIAVLSGGSASLYSMVSVMLANIAIASIYYEPRNIKATWVITNVIMVGAIFFREALYGPGVDMEYIVKALIGVNIGAFMINLLMKNSIDLILQAKAETDRAEELVKEVRVKMAESEAMAASQEELIKEVVDTAANLENTSGQMLEISNRLTEASANQSHTISDIQENVQQFTMHTQECHDVAEKAAQAAVHSVEMINDNNINMENMVHAIHELEETSNRIGGIIKTIDDISFQTNILALNAAVEAARAGAAGKGFAVVADEVRNLAGKSAEAAKITAQLINESIEGVQNSAKIVQDATNQMASVLECSKQSEDFARHINELMGQQQEEIAEIQASIVEVSDIVAANTQTATESADIARSVLSEVEHMNKTVTQH